MDPLQAFTSMRDPMCLWQWWIARSLQKNLEMATELAPPELTWAP